MHGVQHSDFLTARDGPEIVLSRKSGAMLVTRREIGSLVLESGRLAVVDPVLAYPESIQPLVRRAPRGRHLVSVAGVAMGIADEEHAFVTVTFARGPAVRWEPAIPKGQDASSLGPGEIVGCPVSSGVVGYVDYRAADRLEDNEDVEAACLEHEHVDLMLSSTCNVIAVRTGNSGVYPSYWGFSEAGQLVELVTDLRLLLDPDELGGTIAVPAEVGALDVPALAAAGLELAFARPDPASLVLVVRGDGAPDVDVEPEPFVRYGIQRPSSTEKRFVFGHERPTCLEWTARLGETRMARTRVDRLDLDALRRLYEQPLQRLIAAGAIETSAGAGELATLLASADLTPWPRKSHLDTLLECDRVDEVFVSGDELYAAFTPGDT